MKETIENSLDAFSQKLSSFLNAKDQELDAVQLRLNNEFEQSVERLKKLNSVCDSVTLNEGKIRKICEILAIEYREEEKKISDEVIHPEIRKSKKWDSDTAHGVSSIKEVDLSSLDSRNIKLKDDVRDASASFSQCKATEDFIAKSINEFLQWERDTA